MRTLSRIAVLASLVLVAACDACDVNPLNVVPEPGSISGRICDPAEARGIYGARVWVNLVTGDGSEHPIETTTDEDGRFLLEGVPVGTYDVYVTRGSFHATVTDIEVFEDELTALDEAETCIEPEVSFTVYDGHDSVEQVLERIGYSVTNLVDTRHERDEHDENTPSWLVLEFGDYDAFKDNDILFINCAAHEWAIDNASPTEILRVTENLRRFVAEGGSIYLSDWSYDLLELLYPEAVDWFGDDEVRDEAQVGRQQIFVGTVHDEDIKTILGRDRASLKYEQSQIAVPVALGEGSRALITADILVRDGGSDETFTDVPVLLEHRPPTADGPSDGRIIFTTFHNGSDNTDAMDEVLRAIVYSL